MLHRGLEHFWDEYSVLINVGLAIGVLSGILAFIILLMQLAKDGDKPIVRFKILNELMVVGITTGAIGGFWTILNLFYRIMLN